MKITKYNSTMPTKTITFQGNPKKHNISKPINNYPNEKYTVDSELADNISKALTWLMGMATAAGAFILGVHLTERNAENNQDTPAVIIVQPETENSPEEINFKDIDETEGEEADNEENSVPVLPEELTKTIKYIDEMNEQGEQDSVELPLDGKTLEFSDKVNALTIEKEAEENDDEENFAPEFPKDLEENIQLLDEMYEQRIQESDEVQPEGKTVKFTDNFNSIESEGNYNDLTVIENEDNAAVTYVLPQAPNTSDIDNEAAYYEYFKELQKEEDARNAEDDAALEKEFNYTLSDEEQKTVDYIINGDYSVNEANENLNFTRNIIKELVKRGYASILEDQFVAAYTDSKTFNTISNEEKNELGYTDDTDEYEYEFKTSSYKDDICFSNQEMNLWLSGGKTPRTDYSSYWKQDSYSSVSNNIHNQRQYGMTANLLLAARAENKINGREARFISEYLEKLNGTMGKVLKKTPGDEPKYETIELKIRENLRELYEIRRTNDGKIVLYMRSEEFTDDLLGTNVIYEKVEYTPGEDGRPIENEKTLIPVNLEEDAEEPDYLTD